MSLPNFATNIAIIDKNTNLIKNISWGFIYDTSWVQEDEYLIAVDDLAVTIGDFYNEKENAFYHDNEKVKTQTEKEIEMSDIIGIISGTIIINEGANTDDT